MNDKTRKILPLVGALALTSSALLAGTGGAVAKPEAKINLNGSNCVDSSGDYRYYATIDMSSNKGKWVFVEARLHVGDNVLASRSFGRVEKTLKTVEFYRDDGTSAKVTVDIVTRKGTTSATVSTPLLSCPVGG